MPSSEPTTTSTPIPADLFALALHDLPLDSVHAKSAELRNSLAHLLESNIQLRPFAAAGDADCVEAIAENEVVMKRFEERIALCRAEVERRMGGSGHGLDDDAVKVNGDKVNGVVESGDDERAAAEVPAQSGRLTDEELRRRLEARMVEDNAEEDDDGVHL
ncbi:unnamed protein product [Zymoseptoria tritici ST99CH_3D1]|uniref:Uncharacterized protein n=2 Tax=Zymoseptoria tritici TaxID=1047171 RepID=A0A2H1FPA8_ZYMTR|nr:unnamed protein product [Zymoseptoria tritici ST99CH_1E4]SMR45249.1 unnamed protein product [Zymoseptoria tritici ST99CH_3D1]